MSVLERGFERSQVAELARQPLQALEYPCDFALSPLDLLHADLRERASQLIVEPDEPFDSRHARFSDSSIDLTGEIDDLIRLANHLVHHSLLRCGKVAG